MGFNSGLNFVLVLLDLSAALDSTNHKDLVQRLGHTVGVKRNVVVTKFPRVLSFLASFCYCYNK